MVLLSGYCESHYLPEVVMAVGLPLMQVAGVRQNYLANIAGGIACFLFEAVWYSIFLDTWLSGTGRSRQWLLSSGMQPAYQYTTALVMAIVMATAISCVTQLTGKQTALHGMKVAVLLWAGFVLTTWSTEYIFEVRPVSLWLVNAGFWLIGMMLMGAIVGAWKRKV
jgi:hypothetical protein